MAAVLDMRPEDIKAVCESWGKRIWYGAKSGKRIKESAQSLLGGVALRAGIRLKEYTAPNANELIPMILGQLLCEFFLRKRNRYASSFVSGSLLEADLAETTPREFLDSFFEKVCLDFENECREAWRLEPGTFAYAYRKCQTNLIDTLPPFNWSLYAIGKKGSAYGPVGLNEDAPVLDESNSAELEAIPLMAAAPMEGGLFRGESLARLAIYLHEHLCARYFPDASAQTKLYLRNFVYWLCDKYQLVHPDFFWPAHQNGGADKEAPPERERKGTDPETFPLPSFSLIKEREEEIRLLAEETAVAMGREMRLLFRAKYGDELSDEDCARRLKLGSGTTVRRHLRKLQMFLRDEILKSPLLTGVSGGESFSRRSGTLCSELFIFFLEDLTKDEPYDD